MAEIRHATRQDVRLIMRMAREFFAAAALGDFTLDEDRILPTILHLIDKDEGLVLVCEHDGVAVGGLMAIISQPLFIVEKQATEIAWWIDPDKRGARIALDLLGRFEAWAKANGCRSVVMHSMLHLKPEALERAYVRRGYALREKAFLKMI